MAQAALKLADDTTRKPPERITFTKKIIEAKEPPASGKRWLYDHKQPGLALAITATGHRSYFLYRKGKNGRPQRVKIGNYDDLTISNARDEARKLSGEIAKGVDVAAQRRAERDRQAKLRTVEGVWEHYKEHHLKRHCTASTLKNDEYFYEYLPLKRRKLDSITTADVRALHERWSKKPAMANKMVGFLRRLFSYAIEEGLYDGLNPVNVRRGRRRRGQGVVNGGSVHLHAEPSRERYLTKAEAPKFFATLNAVKDQDFKDLVYLLLWTAARLGNVKRMRWDQIDLDAAEWHIPADEAKGGREIIIPLSTQALAILKRRSAKADEGAEYVFPARRRSSHPHISEPKKGWWTFRDKAGVSDLRLHDLRRTAVTYAAAEDVPEAITQAMLGHSIRNVTQVYTRAMVEAIRDGFERSAKALLKAGKTKGGK